MCNALQWSPITRALKKLSAAGTCGVNLCLIDVAVAGCSDPSLGSYGNAQLSLARISMAPWNYARPRGESLGLFGSPSDSVRTHVRTKLHAPS